MVQAMVPNYAVVQNSGANQQEKSAGSRVEELVVPVLDGRWAEVSTELQQRRLCNRKRMPVEQLAPRHTGIRSQEREEPAHTEVPEGQNGGTASPVEEQ
jgi:hypothetical protein